MEQNAEDKQSENRDQIDQLMNLLRDSSKDVYGPHVSGRGEFAPRWQAVAGLVQLGDAAVEPLCQALQDKSSYTRRFAAEALNRIGDPRAVPPLIAALQNSEVYVQRYVAYALAALGDMRAIAPLATALRKPEEARKVHPAFRALDVSQEALSALHTVLERSAGSASADDLRLVAGLEDTGWCVVEVPNTDGGYLDMEHVEQPLDYRPVKRLARQELERRGLEV
jgi:HEAT repeat protein